MIFVDRYPTTATGKIRRVELRGLAATALLGAPARAELGELRWERDDATRWDADRQRVSARPSGPASAWYRRCPGHPNPAWMTGWLIAQDSNTPSLDDLYDGDVVNPARFDALLAAEGVDVAVVLAEYSPRSAPSRSRCIRCTAASGSRTARSTRRTRSARTAASR